MEQVRSFVAIDLPDELRQLLSRVQTRLKAGSRAPAKWVDPDSIHLTLKFLGNVDTDMINRITLVLQDAVRGIAPLHLEVKGLGAFPNLKRVQVVWVGMGGDLEGLSRLQRQIDSSLKSLGFTPESRPFNPHLTLARMRDRATPDERQRLGQLIEGTSLEEIYSFRVDAINLMKSQLTREGAIYRRLAAIALK